jgi:hypothetical protein
MTGSGIAHALHLKGANNSITAFNTTSGSGSIVYYDGTSDQAIFNSSSYQNLVVGGSGTKTIQGATLVNEALSV